MIALAVEALIGSALLMALVLAVRTPVRRMFGAHVAYALWLTPVLRVILPPLPQGWREQVLPSLATLPAPEPFVVYLADPVAALPVDVAAAGIGWPVIVLAAWVFGATCFLAWQVTDYFRFRYRLLRNGIAVDRIGSVTIVQSAAASGPLAFGILDRVIAYPQDFASRFDAGERRLALEHELGHHARGDLIANWVALTMLALHWFNPLAWFAFRAFRADQEMANDAGVLAKLGSDSRHAYGCAIVKAAHGRAVTAACHLHTVKDLKGRLRMLGRKRTSRPRMAAGVMVAGGLALAALGLTASGTQAAEKVRVTMEDATGIPMPALPAATVPPAAAPPQLPAAPRMPEPPAPPSASHSTVKRVTIVRDGKRTDYEGEAADVYLADHPMPQPPVPPVPPVLDGIPPPPPAPPAPPEAVDRKCGTDGAQSRQTVIRQREDGRQIIIVCTDRIERMTTDAASLSRQLERVSLRRALARLQQSRAGLAANTNLSMEHRRDAIAGLDEAIVQMREDIARRD